MEEQVKKRGRKPGTYVKPVTTEKQPDTKVDKQPVEQNTELEPKNDTTPVETMGVEQINGQTVSADTTSDKPVVTVSTGVNNSVHTISFKHVIGDKVWVPEMQQVQPENVYGIIGPQYKRVPTLKTVATVVFTNKISYTFKESHKLVVAEQYVCDTQEECEKICAELNE